MTRNPPIPLKILIAEDSEDDALLVERELQRGGYQPNTHRVDTAASMRLALQNNDWDLVIADHNMPGFNSSEALSLVRELAPDLPFILVSGSIGEEIAVEAMKSGANDYVMKNNLARLLPAIKRELREADNRREHEKAQATIHHMAYHDSLTGLVNRAEFEHRLETAVESAHDSADAHALLYLDLDQFKLVNDSAGHMAGDDLLRRLAKRLQQTIRGSDTLARLGGDEFGVLLNNCPMDKAMSIAQNLLDSVTGYRFIWQERSFRVGVSIGLVRVSADADAQTTLSMADMACYAAKDLGRNRIHVYTEGDEGLSQRRGEMQWIPRLQRAMENDELLLYKQCIHPLQGTEGHSELLLRLRGEDGKLITPDRFIPAAERYNLMPAIDRWVIKKACQQLQSLHQSSQADEPRPPLGTVFINLSATSLSDSELIDYIRKQLHQYQIPCCSLGFEITETAAIADFDCAQSFVTSLHENGCKVALDDFGTGMSSFAYLKSLAVDFIKIDGEFVRTMLDDDMNSAIVGSVNHIGHIAGIKTIAEYVESNAIQERLTTLGIDFAQGWAIEKPQPFS